MIKLEITLSREPTTILSELRQPVQDAWDDLSQHDIRHLYDRLLARILACVTARGDTLCIDVTVWAHLTLTCVSFGLNLLILQWYSISRINFQCNEFVLKGVAIFSGSVFI